MKFFCGIVFAWGVFVLLNAGIAQQSGNGPVVKRGRDDWQYYDSVARASVFYGDTLLAIENYRKATELNPNDEQLSKNYRKLTQLYIQSNESLYNIHP